MELLTARRPRRHQRRRARDRHQREGDPERRAARGREAPRHGPRRLRRVGGDRRHVQVPVHLDCVVHEARPDGRRRARGPRRRPGRLSGRRRAARGAELLRGPRRARESSAISTAFATGAALLDTHSDPVHNRTVLTLSGPAGVARARRSSAGARACAEDDRHARATMAPTRASGRSTSARSSGSATETATPLARRPSRRRGGSAAEAGGAGVPLRRARLGASAVASAPSFAPAGWSSSAPARIRRAPARLRPGGAPSRAPAPRWSPPARRWPPSTSSSRARRSRRPARSPARLRESGGGLRRRAGDRDRPRRTGAPRCPPTSTTRSPCRSPRSIERVRELAAAHGARPWSAEIVGLVPEAALDGWPDDLPLTGFDPAPST